MGTKICHNHYFHPIHILTKFPMNTIFQQTLEAYFLCVPIYTKIFSKREGRLKLVARDKTYQTRLIQTFSDWIIQFVKNLFKYLKI